MISFWGFKLEDGAVYFCFFGNNCGDDAKLLGVGSIYIKTREQTKETGGRIWAPNKVQKSGA
jgi:hypothetical protein